MAKASEARLSQGREAIEAFWGPTRSRGSYGEEASLRDRLQSLGLSRGELRLLRLRLPRTETGVGTTQARIERVRALLTELED